MSMADRNKSVDEERAVPWELFHSLSLCSSQWITQEMVVGCCSAAELLCPQCWGLVVTVNLE